MEFGKIVKDKTELGSFYINRNNEEEVREGVRMVASLMFKWDEEILKVTQVKGGITNLLYKVENPQQTVIPPVLVRVFGEKTELLIDREVENSIFRRLHELGFAPPFYGTFGNGRIEGFLNARSLDPTEMFETEPIDFQTLIARQVAIMHDLPMDGDKTPKLWSTLEAWMTNAKAITFETDAVKREQLRMIDFTALQNDMDWLKTQLPSSLNHSNFLATCSSFPEPVNGEALKWAANLLSEITFCHNDLLSGNMIYSSEVNDVTLIDYEYGGWNYCGFDIANHFCEYAGFDFDIERWYPNPEQQRIFLETYINKRISKSNPEESMLLEGLEDECFTALTMIINRFALASHFFWGLWAIIQSRHSPIDFDFLGYAMLRLEGYQMHKQAFFSPESIKELTPIVNHDVASASIAIC